MLHAEAALAGEEPKLDMRIRAREGILLLALLCVAVLVRLQGLHWLEGYGYTGNYSFHPDDYRFIVSADDFQNPRAKPGGYPLFMSTQLYLLRVFVHKILALSINDAVLLRCISLGYSVLALILNFVFLRTLGFSQSVAFLSTGFLAFSPLNIIFSHFGTADETALFFFYLTIVAAWLHQSRHAEGWFYLSAASAGVSLAVKFFLPALVPPAVIALSRPAKKIPAAIFLFACIFTAFFCAASFFNFTPWDANALLDMLLYDNLRVAGGVPPWQQILLYGWDLVPTSGSITAVLAIGELLWLARKLSIRSPFAGGRLPAASLTGVIGEIQTQLRKPSAVLVLALLAHAGLIVLAQVHFARHVLPFVPIVCLLAALAVRDVSAKLCSGAGAAARRACAAGICLLLGALAANGWLTDRVYAYDIRRSVGDFLAHAGGDGKTQAWSNYTYLRGVSLTSDRPDAPYFVICDVEYARYLQASRGGNVFHLWGGQARANYFAAMLAGQTNYEVALHVRRQPPFSLEDLLAAKGVLPAIGTSVPDSCYVFKQRTAAP